MMFRSKRERKRRMTAIKACRREGTWGHWWWVMYTCDGMDGCWTLYDLHLVTNNFITAFYSDPNKILFKKTTKKM